MRLKKTLGCLVLTASLAMAPVSAEAMSEREFLANSHDNTRWIADNKDEARAIVFGANVVFNCIKSGVGSYVHDKGFWSGCAKGSLAGTVSYFGEWVASYNEYPMVGAVGKLTHDLGVSMSDNVMRGEGMFSQYQTEFGPVTFTFRDSFVPSPSFTLTPAIGMIAAFAKGQRFDFEKSLYNLTPVFEMEPKFVNGVDDSNGVVLGYSNGNVISYAPWDGVGNLTISHEFNHALFWSKLRFCGDLMHWLPKGEEIHEWWNVGQDLGFLLMKQTSKFSRESYYNHPIELDAYSMQRW